MGGVLGGDATQCLADGVEQIRGRAGFGGAQDGLDLAPHQFDGVQVGRIGGQELDARADGADQREGVVIFVRAEVVHDHHVAGAQRGAEDFADVGAENVGIGGRLDRHALGGAVEADRGDHGGSAPVAVGAFGVQPFARCAAIQPRHIRLRR